LVSITLRAAFADATIVTATKSGERDLQTIPMAITAISSTTLGRFGTPTLFDAAVLAPSVTLSQNVGFGQLTIRGIGTNLLFGGSDPSSAMYIDGVYLARPAMEFVQFLDVDRMEVLRGPQGTLYGRNAVGGADQPDLQDSNEHARGRWNDHRGYLRRRSGQRTRGGPPQTRPRDGLLCIRSQRPGRLCPGS
jgi:outer membrane receptor for monomeric catechols